MKVVKINYLAEKSVISVDVELYDFTTRIFVCKTDRSLAFYESFKDFLSYDEAKGLNKFMKEYEDEYFSENLKDLERLIRKYIR